MAGTMYAWSPILHAKGRVNVGEEVTAEKLGISDDEFNELIESGAVRSQKYPEDVRGSESPREAQLRKVREAGENVESLGFTPTQADRMGSPDTGTTAVNTAKVSEANEPTTPVRTEVERPKK